MQGKAIPTLRQRHSYKAWNLQHLNTQLLGTWGLVKSTPLKIQRLVTATWKLDWWFPRSVPDFFSFNKITWLQVGMPSVNKFCAGWILALFVWLVVFAVQRLLWDAQKRFVQMRIAWLQWPGSTLNKMAQANAEGSFGSSEKHLWRIHKGSLAGPNSSKTDFKWRCYEMLISPLLGICVCCTL